MPCSHCAHEFLFVILLAPEVSNPLLTYHLFYLPDLFLQRLDSIGNVVRMADSQDKEAQLAPGKIKIAVECWLVLIGRLTLQLTANKKAIVSNTFLWIFSFCPLSNPS